MKRTLLGGLIALLLGAATAGAQQDDVIRGQVTGPDGKALEGVTVRATSYSGAVSRTARTDRVGRYTIVFPRGEGDYWLEFAAIGYLRKRFEIKRIANEEVLLGDTRLASSIATLEAVQVNAGAPRALPSRNDVNVDVGGTDRTLATTELPPESAGNLTAAAALIPGMQLIPGLDGATDAFSALGISPDQNNTSLNGLGSSLSALPRDAQTTAIVRTFNYDPAIGGFGGAQVSIVTRPGSNFSNRSMSALTRTPSTEITTDVAEQQGAKNTLLSFGGGAAGPIRFDRSFYNFSYQADRDYRVLRSLTNTNGAGLTAAGVAPDSAKRLLGILDTQHVPSTTASVPRLQETRRLALQGNVDIAPGGSGVGHAFNVSGVANVSRASHAGLGPAQLLAVPANNSEATTTSVNAALRHSNYLPLGVLSVTTIGMNSTRTDRAPYLQGPRGTVRVRSDLDDESALRTLSFGGNVVDQASRTTAFELLNQSTWYQGNNRHALKLTTNARYERARTTLDDLRYGAFTFASLADLEAGRAESFERVLGSRTRDADQIVVTSALGDSWRPTTNLQLQYGLRIDANRLLSSPPKNELLATRLGLENDALPNRVFVSPRLGIQWYHGAAPQLALFMTGARPPRAVIQGGVGVFQNIATASALANPVLANTGLADGIQQIRCVGAATPRPTWDAAQTPTECADGSVFANAAPNVSLYDRGFRQPRVLRANLSWSGPIWSNRYAVGGSAQYQRGLHQTATIDGNLDPTIRFTLDGEHARPVFVPIEAIVPATGVATTAASRRDAAFNRVNVLQSNLRQETRLASVSLRPVLSNTSFNWSVTYTHQQSREEFVGFASAAGSPFQREWSRSPLPRAYNVTGTFFYNAFDLVRITGMLIVVSGAPFTPIVLGDVNGDGSLANDRAFVFDPAATNDTLVGAAMARLLSNGASVARTCLARQLGRVAERAGCTGPWQATSNLNLSLNSQKLRLPGRARVTVSVNNPLVLADIIAHGQDDVRGWGQLITPDQTLLAVRGFDATTRRFRYEVNERFGSTRPDRTIQRAQTFFSVGVSYDLGPSRERQLLTQRLDVGRTRPGERQAAGPLRQFGLSTIPNPITLILQQPDSFRLTQRQADSLVSMNRRYSQRADSLWTEASAALAALPESYSAGAAYRRYVAAREQTIDHLILIAPSVWNVLTDAQRRLLPQAVRDWLDVRVLRAIRSSTSG